MTTSSGQSVFPRKTAMALATVAISLVMWHWLVGRSSSLYPPGMDIHSLGAVAELSWVHPAARPSSRPRPVGISQSTAAVRTQANQPADAWLIDNAGSLDRFYAVLAKLDAHAAHAGATVVHFGDSPTTADLITGDVRQQLQQRFGDAGPGFNLIAKPWAWYQHRNIDETDSGWKFTTAVGVMREGVFGIGGITSEGGKGATARYKFSGAGPDSLRLIWRNEPAGTVVIEADGVEVATVETAAPLQSAAASAAAISEVLPQGKVSAGVLPPQVREVKLPANSREVSLLVSEGSVRLDGVVFERNQPGLVYDSIGLNGASVTVLSRALAKETMKQSFVQLHPDLIVINYGTNEAGYAAFVDKQYEGELRTAIVRVREAAPHASILLMSPMDRGERGAGNAIATMETIPKIVAIQQRVAAETGCGFFNTFQAMGGKDTMQRWYEGKPRLVSGDLIHPTPQGAKMIASSFVDQIEQGYTRYKSRIGPASAVASNSAALNASPMGENTKR